MKDIKSILIGVFATTCLFLFMGQTSNDSEVGRYQAWFDSSSSNAFYGSKMIDTSTGQIYVLSRASTDSGFYWSEMGTDKVVYHNKDRKKW